MQHIQINNRVRAQQNANLAGELAIGIKRKVLLGWVAHASDVISAIIVADPFGGEGWLA